MSFCFVTRVETLTNAPEGKIPRYLLLRQLAVRCEELPPACFHAFVVGCTNPMSDHSSFLHRTLLALQIGFHAVLVSWPKIYIRQSSL